MQPAHNLADSWRRQIHALVSVVSSSKGRIVAAWPMQSLARPAGLSKGCFSESCCVLTTLLAQTRFLRYRFALLTSPPAVTRKGECIGCDHAAQLRKEGNHEQQQTIASSLCRQSAQAGQRSERLLARSRRRLASQNRQGLRHRYPRRHQRERTYRLHRAQEGRRQAVTCRRSLGLWLRRAVLSPEAVGSIAGLIFLPAVQIERNAGRKAFRVSHVVSMLNHSAYKIQFRVAMRGVFRFSSRMIRTSIPGSKLCACSTRPASKVSRLRPTFEAQLGKEGRTLPLHPSPVPLRAATETVPVSAPSAERA
jgi:hypothetical protein